MGSVQSALDILVHSSNTLFIRFGAVMVLALHAGFAFLEVGTIRQKNQVNALSKILSDLRLPQEEEYYGANLSIHQIGAVSQD
ncbi:ammonium transporter, Amt family [Pseudomonas mucidolens]|uniref:Ammonium transporter, Amt family n=1 Tax=Pseudomonas mucidolens TaxID=46679 RepID=A0A1H2MZQ6_9PSED|nr:ammonium transporter, Amt family [Pseudomonas mucidolens]SQH32885.1 putative ammonium transporter [Pseudomonas mucidolens]